MAPSRHCWDARSKGQWLWYMRYPRSPYCDQRVFVFDVVGSTNRCLIRADIRRTINTVQRQSKRTYFGGVKCLDLEQEETLIVPDYWDDLDYAEHDKRRRGKRTYIPGRPTGELRVTKDSGKTSRIQRRRNNGWEGCSAICGTAVGWKVAAELRTTGTSECVSSREQAEWTRLRKIIGMNWYTELTEKT